MQTQTDVTASPARTDRYIMRRDEVEKRTGFKRAHIYNLMKEGKFPLARRIGMRAVGWDSAEIDRWIAERLGAQA
ncbi:MULTISPECIES: AlpA family transcriptional regulator [Pseudomonas]|uniref:Phage transcriptional regulator, AlpA n=1 Tax=Pseudomonas syringae pv. aceris TaxID=199198 RepID=A0A0L8IQ41_PSESX|nr:AlpA family transcriptional regulator [Pseudomonas syringae]EGH71487.1 Phage transcriptional regulator, AlpA [Pseudomonas syringae pv. aceris str. M302273]KOG03538.1 Phage transcriptional regulator, AlpA [Pseudomonas syringae pv. aceris]KPW19563.1 Phage transcriptional regulator, AlpA [Pseudomonas syringae pv. aceris]